MLEMDMTFTVIGKSLVTEQVQLGLTIFTLA